VITKLLVAALLGDSPTWIGNAPRIGDVEITASILRAVGAGVAVEGDSIAVDPSEVQNSRVPVRYSGLNRIPILMLGPLLWKLGVDRSQPWMGVRRRGRKVFCFCF
jgi:UDP-N-acetylglucosamine 1-carboxyvinyltransferase